ncbi:MULTISPECIES: MarR family winged helix-turn-helix transcriptional regulator [unclassified Streptomyces]|uniref:MarR family winged helix-turn-helix transcriptional regulator n=1 Tax=unclassified Streptomyces TaxID=2593676 RepID=UPI00190B7DD7|nr:MULTISPECIES: MarR family transcriptional regulator [unclassified Streptomyces]MBK3564167.1 winged helix DNA-binding protein [Streptomyces sp. MBT62]MBK6012049.1 winged helix DNA-binding protein [Streptomyces sp. MBT53]
MSLSPLFVRTQWTEHNPGLDTSPMELISLLKHAGGLLNRAVEPLYAGAALTAPEVDMLVPLRHATEPVIARRLAEWLGLSRAGVSKALGKLEKRGFIARTPNPADRRAALVTITPAGAKAVDDLFPRQLAAEVNLLAGLGENRDQVLNALERLVEAMERQVGRE